MSALVVVMLALTGWALNHTGTLRLADRNISIGWLVDWYGIGDPSTVDVYIAGTQRLAWVDGNLYLDDSLLAESIEQPVGIVADAGLVYVFTPVTLTIFGVGGVQVEHVYLDTAIQRVSPVTDGAVILATTRGPLRMELRSLEMSEAVGTYLTWLKPLNLQDKDFVYWAAVHKSRLISVERFLLDLHSGRLFGRGGVWIMDAFALAFLILAVTGIIAWIKGNDQATGRRRARKHRT
jgi:hypothetical protein